MSRAHLTGTTKDGSEETLSGSAWTRQTEMQ